MGYHIGHIHSFILNPFQGCGKIMEIGTIGMGNRNLLLPQVPEINFGLDLRMCGGKK